MDLFYQVKNKRIAIAMEIFEMVYQYKLSDFAFKFGMALYKNASLMVNEDSQFDSEHFALGTSIKEIAYEINCKPDTMRQPCKSKKEEDQHRFGLTPKQELQNIGFIFEEGGFITHHNKQTGEKWYEGKKGHILIPLFSNGVNANIDEVEIRGFRATKFGVEQTRQRIRMLIEMAENEGKLLSWDKIDYFNGNIKNDKILKADSSKMKEMKVRRQFFRLLANNGIDPLKESQKNFASINQIITEIANNHYYESVESAIMFMYGWSNKLTEKELNERLRSIAEKNVTRLLERAYNSGNKQTFAEEREFFVERNGNELKNELNQKLAQCKDVTEKVALLQSEKESCYARTDISVHILDDYYQYILYCLNNQNQKKKQQEAFEEDFLGLEDIEFEFNGLEDPFAPKVAV
jgi:hypothetical protein